MTETILERLGFTEPLPSSPRGNGTTNTGFRRAS
jgi:hypothetical protein